MSTSRADHAADSPRGSLEERCFQPIDIGLIVVFRVIFGSVMLFEVGRYFTKGWIDSHFVDPGFHFTYYGFGWVRPWAGNGMHWHFAVVGVLATMIACGFFYRVAAVLFFFAFTYIFLLDQAYYLNHLYLISLLSLIAIFLPAERSFSIDAIRKPEIRSQTVPVWTLWLLRFQIGLVYVFGGIAKLDHDWFEGAFARMALGNRTDFPFIGRYFNDEWMVMTFVWGGLLLDLFIVPLLLWNRTRIPAYMAVILFHTTNARLFHIGIFPLFMVAASMLFFPADSLRGEEPEAKTKAKGRKSKSKNDPAAAPPQPSPLRRRVTLALLAAYAAFQVLMPLRHHLYPGNVNWTEEGHRFAWHMKLRAKRATECEFIATDAAGTRIDLKDYDTDLNEKQRSTMAERPDMLLQYVHHLAWKLEQAGYHDVEIRVRSLVSLNGREPQLLVDPQVDLASEPRNLKHADWILPLNEPLPDRSADE